MSIAQRTLNLSRRDQFNELMDHLAEGSAYNVKVWQYQYENFFGERMSAYYVTSSFIALELIPYAPTAPLPPPF